MSFKTGNRLQNYHISTIIIEIVDLQINYFTFYYFFYQFL